MYTKYLNTQSSNLNEMSKILNLEYYTFILVRGLWWPWVKHYEVILRFFIKITEYQKKKKNQASLNIKNLWISSFIAFTLIFHNGIVWGYKVHIDIVQFIAAVIGFVGICHFVFTKWISSVVEFTKVFLFQSLQ